jgi:hypothetical protein
MSQATARGRLISSDSEGGSGQAAPTKPTV